MDDHSMGIFAGRNFLKNMVHQKMMGVRFRVNVNNVKFTKKMADHTMPR